MQFENGDGEGETEFMHGQHTPPHFGGSDHEDIHRQVRNTPPPGIRGNGRRLGDSGTSAPFNWTPVLIFGAILLAVFLFVGRA